mgnify:FL=1
MSIENKDMKKKVTVVGAIALSAVLASGVGYTSYNILKEKTTEEKHEEQIEKKDDGEVVDRYTLDEELTETEDVLEVMIAQAAENEESDVTFFDEEYLDLDDSIANVKKNDVQHISFFDEEDDFKELNDSIIAVAKEEKTEMSSDDVAMIEPDSKYPTEPEETAEPKNL